MKRRFLLQSAGAAALSTVLPAVPMAAAPAVATIDPAKMKLATMLARAHNRSSVSMLQRLMQLSPAQAQAIQTELLKRGIIQANSTFGMHKAIKPLWDGAFVKAPASPKAALKGVKKLVEAIGEDEGEDNCSTEQQTMEAKQTHGVENAAGVES